MTELTSTDAAFVGDAPNQPDTSQQTKHQPNPLQLQAELLTVQESLDTLAHLMRHCQAQSASLPGIAALLDNMSSQVADVSLQLAA